jgi:phosphoglucomutase
MEASLKVKTVAVATPYLD